MPQLFGLFFGLTALLSVFFPAPVMADPGERVGRISVLDGPSLFRINRDDRGTQATLNRPLSSGAIIDTEKSSRVEIWIGSSAFRLAAESRLEFGLINDRQMILNLATGTLSITLRDNERADEIEVRTPHGRLKFASAGSYRVDVGTLYTNLSTLTGNAYVPAGEHPIMVGPMRMLSMGRNGMLASYSDLRRDHFDDWTALRDAATREPPANQHPSPGSPPK